MRNKVRSVLFIVMILANMVCLQPVMANKGMAKTAIGITVVHQAEPHLELSLRQEINQSDSNSRNNGTVPSFRLQNLNSQTRQQVHSLPCSFEPEDPVDRLFVKQTATLTKRCQLKRKDLGHISQQIQSIEAVSKNQSRLISGENSALRLTIVTE